MLSHAATGESADRTVVFRSRGQAIGGVAFGLFVAAIGVATAPQLSSPARAAIQAVAVGAVGLSMAWAFARTRVCATPTGIVVRNPLSTRTIPWSAIAGFRIGRQGILGAVCLIDMIDGSTAHAFAIQVPNRSLGHRDTKEQLMVAELQERLRRSRQAPGPELWWTRS